MMNKKIALQASASSTPSVKSTAKRGGVYFAPLLLVGLVATIGVAACSDDSDVSGDSTGDAGTNTGAAGGTSRGGSSSVGGASAGSPGGGVAGVRNGAGGSAAGDTGGTAGESGAAGGANDAVTTTLVKKLDLATGQLPEGLAIRDGAAYLAFAPGGQIGKYDLGTNTLTAFATLPTPTAGKGFAAGLTFSNDGSEDLYAALVSFVPEVQAGIYRVGSAGGAAALFASDPAMIFPNGLLNDADGSWYVADSNAGAIFKLSKDGKTVTKWATGALLTGNSDNSCAKSANLGLPFSIGANGIVRNGNAFYVTNTDLGVVARVAIQTDGTAGAITAFSGPDCAKLGGADGIILRDGTLFVANNYRNEIVKLDAAGTVTTVSSDAALDFPASLEFLDDSLYVSNFAFMNAQMNKGTPALVRIDGKR